MTFGITFALGKLGRQEKELQIEILFEEMMCEIFPVMKIDKQSQEAQTVSNRMNQNRPTSRHIISKMPNVKHRES